ncbi:fimbrial protein [Enterobacter cancerogenus]
MNINISGTVVVTGSCTFNSASQSVESVNFGDITYHSVNGFALEGEYRQALNSEMTCTGDTDGSAIMTFASSSGTVVDFNGKKLLPVALNGVNSNNLGIELLVNGKVQDVGAAFDVDMATPPTIEAELVQTGSKDTVSNSAILSAAASLTMEFQ